MECERRYISERFTTNEKRILFQLVGKRAAVFACKRTDAIASGKRQEAWNALCNEYNSYSGVTQRTVQQLRKCWQNEKTKRKKALTVGCRPYSNRSSIEPDTEFEKALSGIEHYVEYTLDDDPLSPAEDSEETVVTAGSGLAKSEELDTECSFIELDSNEEHSCADSNAATAFSSLRNTKHRNSSLSTPTASASTSTRDAAIEKELSKRLEKLQRQGAQNDQLHSLCVKEQRYKTEKARLELENAKKQFKREEELHAFALEESKLRLRFIKQKLHDRDLQETTYVLS